MAIPDGKPATDFSAMNREWVRAVAKEAAEGGGGGGGGIPAPENPSDGDVLTFSSTDEAWVAAAPSESVFPIIITSEEVDGDYVYTFSPSITDIIAAKEAGKIILAKYDDYTSTQYNSYYNSASDWGIGITFASWSIQENGIALFVETYEQTNADESMTYSVAESLLQISE